MGVKGDALLVENIIIKGNAPTIPGPVAVLGSISIDRKGSGLGVGLSLEPVDSKDRGGWTVAGGGLPSGHGGGSPCEP